ncbi:hypothetical protein FNV43_RR16099 [Rhamnella rubrinervis]|uniref:EngC GTPase domain-containing protein n=1 Tax=Rhamnella rubrinervis TaxID=2594499 RepID=A0A8K0GXS5_9ROSA|nr:hypothetical protein FNV43_RR16099 [Rhamnella rubrinervis]
MDQPTIKPFTLTRFLVEAESTGIPLTLALNKSELVNEEGFEPLFCSVESKYGLDFLAFILRDQITVIMGPSGVGKSSLINALRNKNQACDSAEDNWFEPILGSKWFEDQRVGEVSTRRGGYLADTPGFNQPSLIKVTKQSLAQAFPEHVVITFLYCFPSPRSTRLILCRYKVGDKGVQQAEQRLEPKKHGRQSRKQINKSVMDELDDDNDDNLPDEEHDPMKRAVGGQDQ